MKAPGLLRSMLFAPAHEARKVARLATSGADAVVLDLEDAVATERKAEARDAARGALPTLGGLFRVVRVNGLASGLTADDLAAVVCDALDAIVLPKAETEADLARLEALIVKAEAANGVPTGSVGVIALVESAAGIAQAGGIARAGGRLIGMAFGSADLGTDLGLPRLRGDLTPALAYGRAKLVYDARGAGLPCPVDGPFLDIRDGAAFEADCRVSAALGFRGRICIHPDQVAIANRAYAPDEAEVALARRVVAAFAEAGASGSAAIAVEGIFVDAPVARKAAEIVALADAIAAKG